MTSLPPRTSRRAVWITLLFAVGLLVPAGYGFTRKFLELVSLVGDDEGSFAVVPVLNYLLASLGFLFLFLWAIGHGMFRDIERPKHVFLTNEQQLDRTAGEEDEAEEWRRFDP